jgi:hypothetical protein
MATFEKKEVPQVNSSLPTQKQQEDWGDWSSSSSISC